MIAPAATYDPAARRAAIKAENARLALAADAERAARIAACAAPRTPIAPSTEAQIAKMQEGLYAAAEKYGARF